MNIPSRVMGSGNPRRLTTGRNQQMKEEKCSEKDCNVLRSLLDKKKHYGKEEIGGKSFRLGLAPLHERLLKFRWAQIKQGVVGTRNDTVRWQLEHLKPHGKHVKRGKGLVPEIVDGIETISNPAGWKKGE